METIATFLNTTISVVFMIGGLFMALLIGYAKGFNNGKEAARLESFTFSGIVNTSKQGLPVPIAYGRVYAGSAVISSGLDVDQLV